MTASLRFVLKLLRQHAFSKQSGNRVCVCVCAFMGCCDSIPQVCFKVAATARFFKTKCCCGFVCVHLWVAVTASLRFVLKLLRQHTFSKQVATGCVCVHLWVAVTASFKLKASMFFFSFLGAVAAVVAL